MQEEEQVAWKRLIRVLGHELSNSLAPIKSIAGSLLARVDNMEGEDATLRDFRRGLGVVESRADALHRFVQSYRLLAQLPPPQLKPVPLAPLLERVVLLEQRLAGSARSRTASRTRRRSRPAGADVHQPAGQRRGRIAGQRRRSRCAPAGGSTTPPLLVTIEDRGLGIANTENLFVPFYTTKPAGSGVGLALAQQIARAHGGEISLLNREDGEGARATIRLPLALP